MPLRSRLDQVSALEEVVNVGQAHFWEETPGVCVGTVALTVRKGVQRGSVVGQVHNCFEGIVERLIVQVEDISSMSPSPESSRG